MKQIKITTAIISVIFVFCSSTHLISQEKLKNRDVDFIADKLQYPLTVTFGITISSISSFDVQDNSKKDKSNVLTKISALKKKLENDKENTDLMIEIAELYYNIELKADALKYIIDADNILQKLLLKKQSDMTLMKKTAKLYSQIVFSYQKNRDVFEKYTPFAIQYNEYLLNNLTDKTEKNAIYDDMGNIYFILGDYAKSKYYYSKIDDIEEASFETIFMNEIVTVMVYLSDNFINNPEFSEKIKTTDVKKFYDYSLIERKIKKNPDDFRYKTLLYFEQLLFLYFKAIKTDPMLTLDLIDKTTVFGENDTILIDEIDNFLLKLEKNNSMKKIDLYNMQAMLYCLKKDPQKAISYYEKAFNEDPTDLKTMSSMVYLYVYTFKDYKSAANVILRKNKGKEELIDYIWLGTVYGKNKQYKEAIEALQKGLKLDSNNIDAQYTTGALYLKMGEYSKAKDHIVFATANNNGDYKFFDQIIISQAAIKLFENNKKEAFTLLINLWNNKNVIDFREDLREILITVFKRELEESNTILQ
jgi:tetratricopeptide (TPR) repeat protein